MMQLSSVGERCLKLRLRYYAANFVSFSSAELPRRESRCSFGSALSPAWPNCGLLSLRLPGIDTRCCLGERSEQHPSELQSLMRLSYAVFRMQEKVTRRLQSDTTSRRH